MTIDMFNVMFQIYIEIKITHNHFQFIGIKSEIFCALICILSEYFKSISFSKYLQNLVCLFIFATQFLISAKVDTPNFYAIEVTPAIHYYMGGLKINPQAKVIDKTGIVIEGLFAAGEVTGGVHGKNRLGGNSISETITFGRISGEEAAKRIANN